ncbi:MAG: tol-pal system-associated acyl-CoA thioesterase [Burkholderiaceae bacterium]
MQKEFRWPMRVYFEDTDAAGIVYYANYLKFMERCRTEWLRALGLPHASLKEADNGVLVVESLEIKYLQPARLEEELVVTARIQSVRKATVELAQHVLRENPQGQASLLVQSSIRLAYVDCASLNPKRMPQQLATLLQMQASSSATLSAQP